MKTYCMYHVLKATEGGKGGKQLLLEMKSAGLTASAATSHYVGHTAVEVYGGKRDHAKAERIFHGRR